MSAWKKIADDFPRGEIIKVKSKCGKVFDAFFKEIWYFVEPDIPQFTWMQSLIWRDMIELDKNVVPEYWV